MIELVTPSATEPVTLARAKEHLRVDIANDDSLITAYIAAARDAVEAATGRVLMPSVWRQTFDAFSGGENGFADYLRLTKVPVRSITSIIYTDIYGAEITISALNYKLLSGVVEGYSWVSYATGYSWPSVGDVYGPVKITYSAGYADAASVPPALIAAILLMVGDLYQSRASNIQGLTVMRNPAVEFLIGPYRLGLV